MNVITFTHKKRNLVFNNLGDLEKITIGIPADNEKIEKIQLKIVGESIVPKPSLGKDCNANSVGYRKVDKTGKKERRVVCTRWGKPYNNPNAIERPIDITRECYPFIYVEPREIKIMLVENDGNKYLIADFGSEPTEADVLLAVNIFVELFGTCCIFKDKLEIPRTKYETVNWEIIPPEKLIDEYKRIYSGKTSSKNYGFEEYRLDYFIKHPSVKVAKGLNGNVGYIAFIGKHCVVFECGNYGNATFIAKNRDWEEISKRTKKELINSPDFLVRIEHSSSWMQNMDEALDKYNF